MSAPPGVRLDGQCEQTVSDGSDCRVTCAADARGVASAALLDVAEKEGADMIVVGSHGAGALRGIVLGSTPYKLLHQSRVPVLVVPHRY